VVHNTYNETVINNVTVNKVSYNGPGGTTAVPTPAQRQAAAEPHVPPTPMQRQHVQEAAKNPALFAKANQGKPPIAATPKPAVFNAPGVIAAHGATAPPPRVAPDGHRSRPRVAEASAGQPTAARALTPPPSPVAHPPLATAKPPAPPPPPPAKVATTPKVVNPPKPPPKAPPKEPKEKHPEGEGEHRE
jgi:hypothetical protein